MKNVDCHRGSQGQGYQKWCCYLSGMHRKSKFCCRCEGQNFNRISAGLFLNNHCQYVWRHVWWLFSKTAFSVYMQFLTLRSVCNPLNFPRICRTLPTKNGWYLPSKSKFYYLQVLLMLVLLCFKLAKHFSFIWMLFHIIHMFVPVII